MEAERCTGLHGVPTMFIAMLDHPEFARFDLKSLRTGIMAGSPCPVEVMRRVVDQMHMSEVTIAYGMTETSPVSFQSAHDDPLDRRVSTVGRVQPHIEVKIVDSQGRIVPPGVTGELLTRGYSVMRGYWGDPAGTAAAIDAARFMHTGDLATIDAEGYCNIVGRLKDMVIRGGENVYPREVEEFLYSHPAIADVQVFGVPDHRYGEELCAWIKLREGAALSEDGGHRVLPGVDRPLQSAQICAFCSGIPDDRHRQGAEIPNAADDDRRLGPQDRKDRLTSRTAKRPELSSSFDIQFHAVHLAIVLLALK